MTNFENHIEFVSFDNINDLLKNFRYGIRGEVANRAGIIENELKNGLVKPFGKVIRANIGDGQAMGQKPVTFFRQVMALCTYPDLLKSDAFPEDAKQRAVTFLDACAGRSIGSYSDGTGLDLVKHDVAKFITERDGGIPSNADDILLTPGASGGIKLVVQLLLNNPLDKKAGFMVPIPQYPYYSVVLKEFYAEEIGYHLDEDNNWGLMIHELERTYNDSLKKCQPKAIVIINPGNPTGQVLTLENIQEIIKWAYEKKLVIIADEVYQDNVFEENIKFYSFKKVAYDLGFPYSKMEIVSFFSTSKGFMGECGVRAGYLELANFNPVVKRQLKLFISMVCSSIIGQACLYTAVNPPRLGEPSYQLFLKEKQDILNSLKMKAKIATEMFNKIEGVKCNPIQGAMFAFPRIHIPEKAIAQALANDIEPDLYFCLELINQTGISVVPGSGFNQQEGVYHFRTTILLEIEELIHLINKFKEFYLDFIKKWA